MNEDFYGFTLWTNVNNKKEEIIINFPLDDGEILRIKDLKKNLEDGFIEIEIREYEIQIIKNYLGSKETQKMTCLYRLTFDKRENYFIKEITYSVNFLTTKYGHHYLLNTLFNR